MRAALRRFVARGFTRAANNREYVAAGPPPAQLADFRKRVALRAHHLGMRELDFCVGEWVDRNIGSFTLEDCVKFEQEVLARETPDLYGLLFLQEGGEIDARGLPYLHKIKHKLPL